MSSTHLPPQPEEVSPGEKQPSGSLSMRQSQQAHNENELFYLEEDEDQNEDVPEEYAAPFQLSNAMPVLNASAASSLQGQAMPLSAPPVQQQKKRRRLPLLLIVGLGTVAAVLILTVAMTAFAVQSTSRGTVAEPPTRTIPPQPTAKPKLVRTPAGAPIATPIPTVAPGGQNGPATTWTSGPLPDGWVNAGLTKPDQIEANRTGLAFTDREMELDFRNAGTRAAHAGTFTAALFILSPAAKARFARNDVRVLDNTLFDRVAQQHLIEAAVDATPKLVKFQAQGNQQFAWVDVAFHLWQTRIDPNNPTQRIEGFDVDQATNQPRIHHMTVLLLRVAPADQGPAAPMGGTGWLVSNYGLDLPALPDIVQPA